MSSNMTECPGSGSIHRGASSSGSSLPEIRESTPELFDETMRRRSESVDYELGTGHDFSVNLDGLDRYLTAILITINAVLLAIHRAGYTKWATLLTWVLDPDFGSSWFYKMWETFFVLAAAFVNATLLIFVVNINVHTPSKSSWRYWLLSSWASLILLNVIIVMQLSDLIAQVVDGENYDDWFARFFLVGTAVVLTICLDVRFVQFYGLFSFLTWNEAVTMEKWNGLRPVAGLPQKQRTRLRDILRLRRFVDRSMYTAERPNWRLEGRTTFKFVKNARDGVQRFLNRRRLQEMRHVLSHRMTDQIMDMPSEEVNEYLDEIMHARTIFHLNVLKHKILKWKDQISEEPGFFEYSAWMKAAITFTILILIYSCIKAIETVFSLDSTWSTGYDIVHQMQAGLDSMNIAAASARTTLEEISRTTESQSTASVQETYQNLTAHIKSLDTAISAFLPDGAAVEGSYQRAGAMMHLVLIRASRMIHDSSFDGERVVSAIAYADSFIRWLKYACFLGYPLGTVIGFYSLYQVMRQHKNMSMGLAREEQVQSKIVMKQAMKEKLGIRQNLLGLEEKYPIGGAVYFFGVLASTAVVQQHVFGMCITMTFAVILNIKRVDVLLDMGGYIALIYLIIIIVNFISSHVIGDHLLTQQGFKIRYPFAFFVFLAVFTIIHAVLGFFYALWRALLLFMTSIWVLNRLEISLFETGKRIDNGHYSFMSMLLLTHVIRIENAARVRTGDPSTPLRHASQSTAAMLTNAFSSSDG